MAKTKKAVIVSTDWKGNINYKDVHKVLNSLGFKVYINQVYLGSFENVVVISNTELTKKEAEKLYHDQLKSDE
jgi:virulence-associated protein VapD